MARRRPTRVTAKHREAFLQALREGLTAAGAAAKAGPHRQRFYELRNEDAAFVLEWEQAWEEGTDILEDEARRRAIEGWDEPVFQKGERVIDADGSAAVVRKYDSRLLELLLRGRRPERFREHFTVEHKSLKEIKVTDIEDMNEEELAAVEAALAARYPGIQPDLKLVQGGQA